MSTAEQGDRGFIDWKPQKRSIPFIEKMDHDQLEEDRKKSRKEYQRVNATVQKLAEESTR